MIQLKCPHCYANLAVQPIPEGSVISDCPSCGKHILVINHNGCYTLIPPYYFKCRHCGHENVFTTRPATFSCGGCHRHYTVAPDGSQALESEIFARGETGSFAYRTKKDPVGRAIGLWRGSPKLFRLAVFAAILFGIWSLISLYISSLPADILTTKAYADNSRLWAEFRQKNPFNTQLAAIRHYDDGSYNILLAEPPENVSADQLEALLTDYNAKLSYYRCPMGYDGWLEDAVVSVNGVDDDDLAELTSGIHILFYGTDYKAGLADFSTVPEYTAYSCNNLNLEITEEELRQWLISDGELFTRPDSTDAMSLAALLDSSERGIFYSHKPGFVLWLLYEGTNDRQRFRTDSRRFALDSDLILGAIYRNGRIAIVGRERQEPVWSLPPLRSETMALLACTDAKELAQSFQRNNIFATKLTGENGGKDWAPILLSPELWHTEYGNLLNVADQMLKSWSMNGQVEYENFSYPKPVFWAFDSAVTKDLGTSSLTYNWNTQGVGYMVEDGGYSVFALNRTGSLPVSYIPDGAADISAGDPVYRAEETAYDFFSSLSNTTLVRVVQYAALYQIFRNAGITLSAAPYSPASPAVYPDEMYTRAEKLMKRIAGFDMEQELIPFTQSVARRYGFDTDSTRYQKFKDAVGRFVDQGIQPSAIWLTRESGLSSVAETYVYISALNVLADIEKLKTLLDNANADQAFISSYSRYLVDSDFDQVSFQPEYRPLLVSQFKAGGGLPSLKPGADHRPKAEKLGDFLQAMQADGINGSVKEYFHYLCPGLRTDRYCNLLTETNAQKSGLWMKSPTVVRSWSMADSVKFQGGHNLGSEITRFRVNRELQPGQVRTAYSGGRKVYEVSPTDLAGSVTSPAYLRRAARLGEFTPGGDAPAVRARNSVIPDAPRKERGLSHAHIHIDATDSGFELDGKRLSWSELLADAATRISRGDDKLPFREIEITNFDRAGVEIQALIDGIAYRMPRGQGLDIPLACFDMANYSTEIVGDRAIVRIPIKARRLELAALPTASADDGHNAIPLKEGCVAFNVPKNRLKEFISIISEYLRHPMQKWNEFRLRRKMKQRGIDPTDIQESTHLRVAKNIIHHEYHVEFIPQEKTA